MANYIRLPVTMYKEFPGQQVSGSGKTKFYSENNKKYIFQKSQK